MSSSGQPGGVRRRPNTLRERWRYNWFTRLAMVRIAHKAGGDTDTSRDYEYTDWADVRAFAATFARSVTARPISPDAGLATGKVA